MMVFYEIPKTVIVHYGEYFDSSAQHLVWNSRTRRSASILKTSRSQIKKALTCTFRVKGKVNNSDKNASLTFRKHDSLADMKHWSVAIKVSLL